MKKNIFSRYFYLCASITLASITVLGVMVVAFTARYFQNDRMDLMQRNAEQAAILFRENSLSIYPYIYINDTPYLINAFNALSNSLDADIFLVDTAGKTIICSASEGNHSTYVVEPSVMEQALGKNGYRGVTRLGGIYEEKNYVVAAPVTVGDVVVGSIFVATPSSLTGVFIKQVAKMFVIGAVVVLIIAFVIIYFFTEMLVHPLRAMVTAADSFARGDFSARIPIEGDDEIQQLAIAFNNMALSLAANEQTRRSFIANVSHELKTPMTTIGGFIDGILDGTIPKERYEYYLGIVSQEVRRLSRLVVSMLGIARIEAGEMSLKPQTVDIHQIVCQTVFTFEQRIEEKQIDIRGLDAAKTFVEADPDLVHQIVYNLIENAVKFTPENGCIEISYTPEGRMIWTAIRNSGAGISKEEIPKLFDRFYKTDKSRSMDKNGVGLGLHIVKSLVHLHQGNITVKSVEGEYSEFSFSLPATAQKQNASLFRKNDKPRDVLQKDR